MHEHVLTLVDVHVAPQMTTITDISVGIRTIRIGRVRVSLVVGSMVCSFFLGRHFEFLEDSVASSTVHM